MKKRTKRKRRGERERERERLEKKEKEKEKDGERREWATAPRALRTATPAESWGWRIQGVEDSGSRVYAARFMV